MLAGRNSSWGEAITISCQEALRVLEASMCWEGVVRAVMSSCSLDVGH